MVKERSQSELYRMIKNVGEFVTTHSQSRSQKFKAFYSELRKTKAPIRWVEQGNDFDLLIWWKLRWNSFNEMIRNVFE